MRTEHEVCKQLKVWFESYGIQCWLNEGENKFITKLSQKKPDIIIYSQRINQYIAIEVKNGNVSKDVYDSSKILDYLQDYQNNKIEYYINGNKIIVSSFTIATTYSMFGHLFCRNEGEPISCSQAGNEWQRINKERGLEPLWEFPKTKSYLRNLWANWRRFRERKNNPGVGIIIANNLNQPIFKYVIDAPILFDQQWEEHTKSQWRVRQKLL